VSKIIAECYGILDDDDMVLMQW